MSCTRPCVCVWLTAHFSSFLRSFLIVSKRNEVLIGLMMEPATGQSWDECRPSIHPNSINNGPRSLSTCPSLPPSTPPPTLPLLFRRSEGMAPANVLPYPCRSPPTFFFHHSSFTSGDIFHWILVLILSLSLSLSLFPPGLG